jgi:cell division protein FtsB
MKLFVAFMLLGAAYVLLVTADRRTISELRAKNDSLSAAEARLIAADAELNKQSNILLEVNSKAVAGVDAADVAGKALLKANGQLSARNEALELLNRKLMQDNRGSQVNAYFCGVIAGKYSESGVTYDEPKTDPTCRSIAADLGVLVKGK